MITRWYVDHSAISGSESERLAGIDRVTQRGGAHKTAYFTGDDDVNLVTSAELLTTSAHGTKTNKTEGGTRCPQRVG